MLKHKEEAQRILDLLINNNWKIKLKDLAHTAQYARNYLRKLEILWNIKKIWKNEYLICDEIVKDNTFNLSELAYELQQEKEKNMRLENKIARLKEFIINL